MKAVFRLRGCAGRGGPSLSTYAQRHVFAQPIKSCEMRTFTLCDKNCSSKITQITRKNVFSDMCAQRWLKSACASTLFDQSLRCPHEETLHPWLSKMCPEQILISLDERPGWSESLQGAHIRRYDFGHYGSRVFILFQHYNVVDCLFLGPIINSSNNTKVSWRCKQLWHNR